MRSLTRLDDWTVDDVAEVFALADAYRDGRGPTTDGSAVMFFPATSLRTRVTFERGAAAMGLQPIVFPDTTLDKPEALADVAGYLASWADVLVVRHHDLAVIEGLADAGVLPVVNAMTDENHPCEVLSDLYALRSSGADLGTTLAAVAATTGPATVVVLFVAFAVHGAAAGCENANEMSLRQSVTPDALLGRTNGTVRSANRTLAAVGAIGGGAVMTVAGDGVALAAVTVVFVAAVLVAACSPLRTAGAR